MTVNELVKLVLQEKNATEAYCWNRYIARATLCFNLHVTRQRSHYLLCTEFITPLISVFLRQVEKSKA